MKRPLWRWIVPSKEAGERLKREFRYRMAQRVADCEIEVLKAPDKRGEPIEYVIMDEAFQSSSRTT